MSKEIFISSTPHETRLAIVEDDALTEIYYERENEYTLAGSIYNGRVTRVLPGMQSSFVDIGLERDAFLYITDFMEEAPDSAEFDTSSNGDRNGERAPRAPRQNGGERPEEAGVRAETSGPGPERSDRAERSERGDRSGRGRRNGRDRNNQDREAGSDATPSQPSAQLPRSDRGNAPRPPAIDSAPIAPPDSGEGSEVGEGTPGADGSRRWRGRRGRRRGRGTPGQPGEPAQDNAAPAYAEGDSSVEDERSFEIDGSAAAPVPAPAVGSEAFAPREEDQRNEREDGPRGESQRGGARRDNGRGQFRGGRSDTQRSDSPRQDPGQRDQRPQRVPRGFTHSRDLYGVESGTASATGPVANAYPGADDEPAPEPIVLPGESLSKYRKGGDEPAAARPEPSVTLAPPANLYTVAAGWDGGATLPGETLSRRRPPDSRPDSRPESGPARHESRGGGQRDRDARRDPRPDRDARPDRGARPDPRRDSRSDSRNDAPAASASAFAAHSPAEQVIQDFDRASVAQTSEGQPEVARAAHPEQFASDQMLQETASSQATAAEAGLPVAPDAFAAAATVPHDAAEYEPSEASASYRVDPLSRSEYRQSAPVLEPPVEAHAEPPVQPDAPESLSHSITPAPGEATEKLRAESSTHAEPAAPVEAHDITSISAAGEMFSEPAAPPDAAQHPAPMEDPEPASPIRHEGAVLSAEHGFERQNLGGFAPGSGDLAEEVIDEEDLDGSTLHASSIEEMDDLEEETLEGAADLGTMLREMSIDHITRTSPEIADEDDLEEDDLEEDDLEEDELDEEGEEEEGREGYEIDDRSELDGPDEDEEQAAHKASPAGQEFFEAQFGQSADRGAAGEEATAASPAPRRDSDRSGGRRDGRRDGRRGRSDRSDRARSTGGSGDRERSSGRQSGNGRGRHSMQSTHLPAISDLLKPGQEILVQIAKEPMAKKGARITSHIALPGRFLVFMPTVQHTGVSRKIESDGERRRLKEILLSEKGEASGGFIVRTAAEGASEEELRSDLRFLLNLWTDIKARSESSKSPALIYHDLNLIERILRDQVTDNFSAIWVDTENEYERVLRFLQRFQPSLIRRVKLYSKETPLFEQFGITEEINKALRSKVWLKSGGSIVINQTEALVAIDINTGKFVGKTARLEDTIVKTNLDAIPEIVRQIRLRDLGGIIIIDFIDMDERKNRNRVMAALEDELKSDRAPSKVLQFNDFGLVAITRKRVKQSLERTLSTTCNVCTGTGMVKSPITVCNDIFVEMRKMHRHLDRGDVMLRVHPEVVKQLKTAGSKWLQEMEEMCGKTILVKSDPSLHPEQFDIH